MIVSILAIAAGLLLSGCAAPSTNPSPVVAPIVAPVPAGPVQARVAVVNPDYRFVVLDFGQYTLPAIGTEVGLYRETNRIGRLRLTEPRRGRLISADVLEGEPRVGDVAR